MIRNIYKCLESTLKTGKKQKCEQLHLPTRQSGILWEKDTFTKCWNVEPNNKFSHAPILWKLMLPTLESLTL